MDGDKSNRSMLGFCHLRCHVGDTTGALAEIDPYL
jgi:hypothetical protein